MKIDDKHQNTPTEPSTTLSLGEDVILPQYQGRSIVNLPDSICQWFGIPTFGMGPLENDLTSHANHSFQQVVVVIIDAVSFRHFQTWTSETSTLPEGNLSPITSISPSTTCAAMTSLWTGQPACRHGIAGYEMWMKEYNMAVNMIVHGPTSYKKGGGTLVQTGFDPSTFLPVPNLGTHLRSHDIEPHAFQHHSILHSGLSQTFLQEVDLHGINTAADMWISVRDLLETYPERRMYITAYWGAVDGYFHRFGPGDERPAAEFKSFIRNLQEHLLDTLSPQSRKETLLLLTADHGQILTPPDPHYHLENHPKLLDMLHIKPTGENRLAYLHIRPGKVQAVREYIGEHWPEKFICASSRKLTSRGLFGPGPYHPRWHSRVGDMTVIAREEAYLWWPNEENELLGRHGGLSRDEMVVPLLTLPL